MMTNEEIRIAIAESCGWRRHTDTEHKYSGSHAVVTGWIRDDPSDTIDDSEWANDWNLPDYPDDSNDAIGLCDVLAEQGWNAELNNGLDKTWECIFRREGKNEHYGAGDTMSHAICEAYLRVVGRWKD